MADLQHWRLNDRYSLWEASCLVLDLDPSGELGSDMQRRRQTVETTIRRAIEDRKLPSILQLADGSQFQTQDVPLNTIREYEYEVELDGYYVFFNDIQAWLSGRDTANQFFKASGSRMEQEPAFLHAQHRHYAPELAAAVNAWRAVTEDATLIGAGSVKQALMKWLIERAEILALSETAVERIATVANWKREGGAPRTPGQPGTGKEPNRDTPRL